MTFKKGDKVSFLPGPRSTTRVVAEVIGEQGQPGTFGYFLVTRDGVGRERRIRPGACSAA